MKATTGDHAVGLDQRVRIGDDAAAEALRVIGVVGFDAMWRPIYAPEVRGDIVLTLIPPVLRDEAMHRLDARDWAFLCLADNTHGLQIVKANMAALKRLGIYEASLLNAFMNIRTNTLSLPLTELRHLFRVADRARLRAAGQPLPAPGPFTLFRGVAGDRAHRRERGLSWTASREVADWFARRYGLPEPAVLSGVFDEADVLAYTDDRQEAEFLVLLRPEAPSRIIRLARATA